LVIEWSSSRVRSFDPLTRQSGVSTTISNGLGRTVSGRQAVIAIAQRSVFVRTIRVPPLGQKELGRIVSMEIAPLLPLPVSEFVIGFKIGPATPGQGRIAVVSAIKTDLILRIHQEAADCGLKVLAVVPSAFGAWLAARAHGITEGAVAQSDGMSLSIDVLSHGELAYSRAVPMPNSSEDIQEEILCTFETAGVTPGRVLALGDPLPGADLLDSKDGLEQLANWAAVEKRVIQFELPEATRSRQKNALRMVAQRAIAATIVAAALCGLAITKQFRASRAGSLELASVNARLTEANKHDAEAKVSETASGDDLLLISTAFHPAQPFSDMIVAINNAVPPHCWLTGLSLERGKLILVRGEAADDATVAKLVKALSVDPRFKTVRLVSAMRSTNGKKISIRFAISFHAMGNLPLGTAGGAKNS
jgi:Tfp pilus assembly protein PilN